MRTAIMARGAGGPEVLALTELDRQPVGPGQARVSVTMAGVNFWDVMQRRGVVPLGDPAIPGVEGVGVVQEVGSAVSDVRVGQRVAWSKVPGSYSTEVVADSSWLVPVPDEVSDAVAASILMQGVTAQYLVEDTWPVGEGEYAVVHAAAGGVGSLLTQLLVARGARVIGVVSRQDKESGALRAGAASVVLESPDLMSEVRELAPDGVAAVFDANGGERALDGLDMLRERGCLVLYGSAAGSVPALDPGRLGRGSLYLTRTSGRDYARTPEEWRGRADDVMRRVVAGSLAPLDGGTWPLAEASDAHRHLESRQSVGKLLLSMG